MTTNRVSRGNFTPAFPQVMEYLGRYTHKSAISNRRLQQVGEGKVRFGYKDYRSKAETGTWS